MVKAPGAAATSTAAGAVLPETVVPLGGGCVPVWGKTSASQVDEEYFTQANGSLYALATTHEEINSSHTLGIAYQQNGSQWSASGTANMTTASGGTVTTAASNGAHWYANHVTYREWTNTCPLVQHEWRPESPYSLLDRYQIVASPTYTHCTTYASGYAWSKSGGTSATYSAGVSLTVLSVSASTNWGSDTVINWTASGRSVDYCGNDTGPASSTLVETHTH